MQRVRDACADAVIDDSMPGPVKKGVQLVFDEVAKEVHIEVVHDVRHLILSPEGIDFNKGKQNHNKCCFLLSLPWRVRSWLLYTIAPFDKTSWQMYRTFSFWLVALIAAFPAYSISEIFFLIILAFEDKRDEFRVVNFILAERGTMFISKGIIPVIIGAARLANCAVTPADRITCQKLTKN